MAGNNEPVIRTAEEIEAELADINSNTADLPEDDDSDDAASSNGNGNGQTATATATAAAEAEAGRKGWVPKHLYKGDPAKWVDAATFNARGERFASNLQREVESLKSQLAAFEGTRKAFVKFHEETLAKKDAELKEAIATLRVQRSEATSNGEHELAVQLEDRIELLREQQKEVKKLPAEAAEPTAEQRQGVVDPVLEEWIDDGNAWFKDDPKLRDYAIALGDQLVKGGETLRGRKFLDKVAAAVRDDFPRKFRSQEQGAAGRRSDSVEGGTAQRSAGTGNGKTERDLPPEDRALMKQFIAEGWTTKEKFLAGYFSRNG